MYLNFVGTYVRKKIPANESCICFTPNGIHSQIYVGLHHGLYVNKHLKTNAIKLSSLFNHSKNIPVLCGNSQVSCQRKCIRIDDCFLLMVMLHDHTELLIICHLMSFLAGLLIHTCSLVSSTLYSILLFTVYWNIFILARCYDHILYSVTATSILYICLIIILLCVFFRKTSTIISL